jgi:tetratricopeptide (TPR) repeat protein
VRAAATLWLAKFEYNRRNWSESRRLFLAYADGAPETADAPAALTWAARAAYADNDFRGAIQIASRLSERYPDSPERTRAAIIQSESLVELARFDEAVLVLDQALLAEDAPAEERLRAHVLKADALFALGADNPTRYEEALAAYRAVRLGESLSPSMKIVVAAKLARTLEKLRRIDEAIDRFYLEVVLAYRDGRKAGVRYDDAAKAAFARAAFRLADEFVSRGLEVQALNVLRLVATSDVPAAAEAERRIEHMKAKGKFL